MASTQKRKASDEDFSSFVHMCLDEETVISDSSATDSEVEDCSSSARPISVREESDQNYSSSDSEYCSDSECIQQTQKDDTFISVNGTVWKKNAPSTSRTRAHNIVKCTPGVSREVKTSCPKDAWDCIITHSIIEEIIHCTNLEGRRLATEEGKQWKNVSVEEMNAFFGILLQAGVEKSWDVPIRELFLDERSNPLYKATMSVNRFEDIRKALRFDDKRTRSVRLQTDKLAPISYVWNLFLDNCRKVIIPSEFVTIDEQLVPFRGKCSFIQYMPKKPSKYGIKIFWLCDAKSSYAVDGCVYTGRKPNEPVQRNLGANIVKELTQTVKNSSRNVTMDNYFTSVSLAEDMLQQGITIVGTIRQNKPDIPKELKASPSREVGSSIFAFKNDVTLVSYVPKRNRSVIMLSTMHHDKSIVEDHPKKKPEIITFYNSTKGGVDGMDQKVRYYTSKRQSRRWPFVLWTNMMDVAALNSYVVFSTQHPGYFPNRTDKRRLFLRELAEELVKPQMIMRLPIPNLPKSVQDALKRCGVSKPTEEEVRAQEPKRRRCGFCPYDLHRKSTLTCSKCGKNVCKQHSKLVCNSCFS